MAIRVITQAFGDATVPTPVAVSTQQPLSATEWFLLSVTAGLTVTFLSRLLFKKSQ